jgi:S-methylmethionine-dependent homocysteine/selenocysteine methylase
MQMTDGEVVLNIMQAKDQKAQISICADLNCCSEDRIKEILKAQGVDLRSLKGAVKKNINHGVKHKPHKNPANAEKNPANANENDTAKAFATLLFRIAELRKQKEEIQAEIDAIVAQAQRLIEAGEKV